MPRDAVATASQLLREPFNRERTKFRVFIADLAGLLILRRIAPILGRLETVELIDAYPCWRRRSLQDDNILPCRQEMAAGGLD
jgi:hypothetical protein